MPEGSEENTNPELFGLPTDRFEAAVDALVELRDSGKLLLFLSRRGTVKLISENEDFRTEFSRLAKDGSIDLEQARKAQDELRQLTSAIIRLPDTDSVLEYLERFYLEDFRRKQHPRKDEFKRRMRPKIEIVSNKIVTEAMKQRARRLATATGACIEELDFEVVSEREDLYRGRTVKDPFLRLRLRYTDGSQGDYQYYGYFIVSFEGAEGIAASSFEIECDLSDIDLLIKRLSDAKQRLLRERSFEGEGQ